MKILLGLFQKLQFINHRKNIKMLMANYLVFMEIRGRSFSLVCFKNVFCSKFHFNLNFIRYCYNFPKLDTIKSNIFWKNCLKFLKIFKYNFSIFWIMNRWKQKIFSKIVEKNFLHQTKGGKWKVTKNARLVFCWRKLSFLSELLLLCN